jgi:hypothetical protein
MSVAVLPRRGIIQEDKHASRIVVVDDCEIRFAVAVEVAHRNRPGLDRRYGIYRLAGAKRPVAIAEQDADAAG